MTRAEAGFKDPKLLHALEGQAGKACRCSHCEAAGAPQIAGSAIRLWEGPGCARTPSEITLDIFQGPSQVSGRKEAADDGLKMQHRNGFQYYGSYLRQTRMMNRLSLFSSQYSVFLIIFPVPW